MYIYILSTICKLSQRFFHVCNRNAFFTFAINAFFTFAPATFFSRFQRFICVYTFFHVYNYVFLSYLVTFARQRVQTQRKRSQRLFYVCN